MIVLDTNVLSELTRPAPAEAMTDWLDLQAKSELVTTAVSAAEMLTGVAKLPAGKRQTNLAAIVAAVLDVFDSRMLPFDGRAAAEYAEIAASRIRKGRPIGIVDAQIAAICRARGATLATRNVKDFDGVGVEVVNPWTADLDAG